MTDTSALLAVQFGEPAAEAQAMRRAEAPILLISAVSQLEACIVAEGSSFAAAGDPGGGLCPALDIEAVPFERSHLIWAVKSWREFGKGRHPAGLNLGDCFSYRQARALNMPLLYKGNDVTHTDVLSVAPHR